MSLLLSLLSGRRSKLIIIVTLFLSIAFIVIRFIPDFWNLEEYTGSDNQYEIGGPGQSAKQPFVIIGGPNSLEAVPGWLTRESQCPACFGVDVCKEVKHSLQIQLPEKLNLSSPHRLYAMWGKQLVVVKTLVSNETFQLYDKYLCHNVSGGQAGSCDVASVVGKPNTPGIKQEFFLPQNLQHAWKIVHSSPQSLPFAFCASKDLVRYFTGLVDVDRDNALTLGQVTMLHASMVLNPEAILLRFFDSLAVRLPVPRILGACGRVVVMEDYGKSLLHYVHSTWETRAELALQILEMIDSFVSTDPKWAFLFDNFHLRSFAVIEDKELLLVDIGRAVIIDKDWKQTVDPEALNDGDEDLCNEECFKKFSGTLQEDHGSPHHHTRCALAPSTGKQFMQHLVCKYILSDSVEHRKARQAYQDHPGLLQVPPVAVAYEVGQLIKECVEEMQAGGRKQAVSRLKEVLQRYASTLNQ